MNILELYSGIGGMHLALIESGVKGKIIASVEINNVANDVYKYNFQSTKLLNTNIEGLSASFIKKLNVNTILMSPPCQPFTRNGLKNDVNDPRSASFLHVLKLLPELDIENILIENVKGFESSKMRNILVDVLMKNDFIFQEFILSPHQMGIPNSRHRYYCLAKKSPKKFPFEVGTLMTNLPTSLENNECFCISDIVEKDVDQIYFLSDILLKKREKVLDICATDSKRSCCFTKAYGRFIEGTGSVYTDRTASEVSKVYSEINLLDPECEDILTLIRSLNLRFFTPREVCRLMSFPESFTFPKSLTDRKKYMLLGNSINIKVVSELIKIFDS